MRIKLTLLIAACVAAAGAAACNGDNSNPDGGDAMTSDVAQPDTGPGPDGGDAGCNFATFVIGLINNHTNGSDQPSTDLGQNCVDDRDAAEFQSLFP
jgi:hypothetical protein